MIEIERKYWGELSIASHAIRLSRQCLNNQLPLIFPPSFHFDVRMDHRVDKFSDVLLLSGLIVKGDVARRQRFKSVTNVDLRPTSYTYVQIREAEISEVFHKAQDLLSRRWYARGIRTFIDGVHDDVDWVLGRRDR
jgi:hypothetical protein